MLMTTPILPIFEFNKTSNLTNWQVVNDGVMGGRSSGRFQLSEEGNGLFIGHISLANNGGFSSVRYQFKTLNVQSYTHLVLRIKGDGKKYQFRIKERASDQYSYITTFQTTADWETIQLTLSDMCPYFRGRKLNKPSFNQETIEEIGFLIGNKIAENFKLEIASIIIK